MLPPIDELPPNGENVFVDGDIDDKPPNGLVRSELLN
jgi:hypothetical protein